MCVKLWHSSLGDWEDILIIHLIVIIKSEVSSFPTVVIFYILVVCLRWLHHHRLSVSYTSQERWVLCLLLLGNLMMCANNQVNSGLMVIFLCLHMTLPHYLHQADLSEGIELLKFLSGIFYLDCVSKIKSMLLIICHSIYGAVHIQLTHFSYDDCKNTCTLFYRHHQIGSMTHLPLFRVMKQWYALYVFLYSYTIAVSIFFFFVVVVFFCFFFLFFFGGGHSIHGEITDEQ